MGLEIRNYASKSEIGPRDLESEIGKSEIGPRDLESEIGSRALDSHLLRWPRDWEFEIGKSEIETENRKSRQRFVVGLVNAQFACRRLRQSRFQARRGLRTNPLLTNPLCTVRDRMQAVRDCKPHRSDFVRFEIGPRIERATEAGRWTTIRWRAVIAVRQGNVEGADC